jgi:rod shape-determining protein MreD
MIKKLTMAFLCGMGLLLIQNLLLPLFLGDRFAPNLITILVVFITMYHSNQLGLFIVFLLGVLLDLTYAELLGVWSGAYIVTFSVLLLLSQHLFVESRMVVFIATTFCALLTEVLYLLISGKFPLLDPLFVLQGLLISIITGGIAIVLFPMLQILLPDADARKRY